MSASGGKATFEDLESGGGQFAVQYNPKEFKVDKAVSWKEHDDQGQTNAGLEFQKGAPLVVTMEMYFDTTNEGNSDVREKWVNKLMYLTNASVEETSEGSAKKKRPPKVRFTWGSFTMTCVLESVNATYIMFAASGTPIRARVSVKMKEWMPTDVANGSGGSYIEGTKVKLVTSSGGTASSIAASNNVSTRALMEANDIEDPFDIPAGTELRIPTGAASPSGASSVVREITDALKQAESTTNAVSGAARSISSLF